MAASAAEAAARAKTVQEKAHQLEHEAHEIHRDTRKLEKTHGLMGRVKEKAAKKKSYAEAPTDGPE